MSDITEKTLKILKEKEIKPAPCWCFTAKNYAFWLLVASAIILGAFSFFALFSARGSQARLFFFFIIILSAVTAGCGLRCTCRGYRCDVLLSIIISLFLIFFIGLLLLSVIN